MNSIDNLEPADPMHLHVEWLCRDIQCHLGQRWSVIEIARMSRASRQKAESQGYVFNVIRRIAIDRLRHVQTALDRGIKRIGDDYSESPRRKFLWEK